MLKTINILNTNVNWAILVVLISSLLIAKNFLWYTEEGVENTNIISSDGLGYYSYLPKVFIENDLSNKNDNRRFIKKVGNANINKYFVGTAVCMLPFFGVGYISAVIFDYPLDGYSFPFQLAISLAGIFYLVLGLWFLSRFLSQLKFSNPTIFYAIILLFFGTNLLTMGVMAPSMSHIYSFALITAFLYAFNTFLSHPKHKTALWLGVLFGLILIIRPTNAIVVLLIPFLIVGNIHLQISRIFTLKNLLSFTIPMLIILCIQGIAWYLQSGKFIIWGYQNEGFYFDDPEILKVLFSFRKGWFIYTPLAFVSLFGFISIYKKNKQQFFSFLLFLMALLYLTSSWWNWFYGSSFGMRALVDFYVILGILLAFLISSINNIPKKLFFALVVIFCIVLNLFQNYQFNKGMLSNFDMNYNKYKALFGVLKADQVTIGGNDDILPYQANKQVQFVEKLSFEGNEKVITIYDSIKKSEVADYSNLEYNVIVKKQLNQQAISAKGNFLELKFSRYEKELNNSQKAQVLVELRDSLGDNYWYYWYFMNEVPSKNLGWKTCSSTVLLPSAKTIKDEISIYIRNDEKANFLIDDFEVKVSSL